NVHGATPIPIGSGTQVTGTRAVTPEAGERLLAEQGSQLPGPGRIPVTPVVAVRRPCRVVQPARQGLRWIGAPGRIRGTPVPRAKSENIRPMRRLTIEATVRL
ncbi:MAG: hypothetical protein ABSB76_40345, partial [Streptosporangiaceae bacterium]